MRWCHINWRQIIKTKILSLKSSKKNYLICNCQCIYSRYLPFSSGQSSGLRPHSCKSFRAFMDNAIILQELVHSFNHASWKKCHMMLKLDLHKAYDRMEWSFVIDTLNQLKIPSWMIDILSNCMSTSLAINWNSFAPTWGLRQGDPSPPYLFVLHMERLAYLI